MRGEHARRLCLGEVGAIFGLEVSRLARSNAETQRLLEYCGLTDTLVIDGDGIYDLRDVNDQIVLGVKGQLAQIELHVMSSRAVRLGIRESHADWLELGRDLIARGLSAPLLVVGDGAPGLIKPWSSAGQRLTANTAPFTDSGTCWPSCPSASASAIPDPRRLLGGAG